MNQSDPDSHNGANCTDLNRLNGHPKGLLVTLLPLYMKSMKLTLYLNLSTHDSIQFKDGELCPVCSSTTCLNSAAHFWLESKCYLVCKITQYGIFLHLKALISLQSHTPPLHAPCLRREKKKNYCEKDN